MSRNVHQTVGPGAAREHLTVLSVVEIQTALGIAAHAHKFLTCTGLGPLEVGANLHGHCLKIASALKLQKIRTCKQQERHKARNGITRQPDEGLALHFTQGHGFARL